MSSEESVRRAISNTVATRSVAKVLLRCSQHISNTLATHEQGYAHRTQLSLSELCC